MKNICSGWRNLLRNKNYGKRTEKVTLLCPVFCIGYLTRRYAEEAFGSIYLPSGKFAVLTQSALVLRARSAYRACIGVNISTRTCLAAVKLRAVFLFCEDVVTDGGNDGAGADPSVVCFGGIVVVEGAAGRVPAIESSGSGLVSGA